MPITFDNPPRPSGAELCRQVAAETADSCVLLFSRGKDAVGAWLQVRRYFKRVEPVFLYLCPDLEFENESLTYYEDFFGQRIHRLPHPSLYRMLHYGVFSHQWSAESNRSMRLTNFDYRDVAQAIIDDNGLPMITQAAIGVRACDSTVRRLSVQQYGPWNKKKGQFFPVWDWTAEELRAELRTAKVKLPIDYKWFGRSFDGIDARFTGPLKKFALKDYERIREFFPLIESDLKRYQYAGAK